MDDNKTEIVPKGSAPQAEVVEGDSVQLGQWYWVKDDRDVEGDEDQAEEWLGCVTHIGSNYVELRRVESRYEHSTRIHADSFYDRCRHEPNAKAVIAGKVEHSRTEVQRLMKEVEAVTARLGVGYTASLSSGQSEGAALAKLDPQHDVGEYKTALVKAKEEELPELFKKIDAENDTLAQWMRAETLPMKAKFKEMKGVIGSIDDRIFNVELYAGLTEKVEQIADGEPAGVTEKIRLMQRRCYMDEECLARYKTGGMEFKDIYAFDAWLAKPENRDRILPFPRCIVAFRVRRNNKLRKCHSFIDFFTIIEEMKWDKLTFLYIRNGDRLYRMGTEVQFEEQLFPDTEHHNLTSGDKLWANVSGNRIELITDAQYKGLKEEYAAKKAEYEAEKAAYKKEKAEWDARKKAAKEAGEDFNEHSPHSPWFHEDDPERHYEEFEPNNLYYDDIKKHIEEETQKFNRIGIIIQGLLDRSLVLHPHPPWKIWSEGGFAQALELVYDDSRALVGGEKPDFEAYRARLNASLKTGSVTVGQHAQWRKDTGADDYSEYGRRRRKTHYSDYGPDTLAKVVRYEPRKKRCNYAYTRKGQSYGTWGKEIRVRYSCDAAHVLNVDAYKPGDFHIFFDDPRTRAEYLEWAPLLLEAEEYHAGNRQVKEPPPPAKRESSWEGRQAYRRKKERQKLVGKAVKLREDAEMKSGKVYKAGTLWRVTGNYGGALSIRRIDENGEELQGEDRGSIVNMQPRDLEVVELADVGVSDDTA